MRLFYFFKTTEKPNHAKKALRFGILSFLAVFFSQSTVFGQNVSTYTFAATTGTYTALTSATNTSLGASDDNTISSAITLPFTFIFGGKDYTKVKISSNGWLTFNENVTDSYPANTLANANLAKPMIMPLWDDLQNRAIPVYVTTGSAPNRIFKVEWSQSEWSSAANNDVISFQVWLYETSNKIEFIYKQGATAVSSGSATIGLYDAHSTMTILNGSGTAPLAKICHTDFKTDISAKPANNQIYQFTPSSLTLADRWWVHIYDNNIVKVDAMDNYVGYYSFTTSPSLYPFEEGFRTNTATTDPGNHGWTAAITPTDATTAVNNTGTSREAYIGCPTTAKATTPTAATKNDRYKYHFRRDGFDCGFYKVTMQMLDDSAKMYINNLFHWGGSLFHTVSGNEVCANGCNNVIGYLYLDENTDFELRVKENTGFTGGWMDVEKIDNITYYTDILTNNTQVLCLGSSVVAMTGVTPSVSAVATGDLLNPSDVPWKFKWEQSTNGSTGWTVIPNETAATLSPGITNTTMYYRRLTILCDEVVETSDVAEAIYTPAGNVLGQNGNSKTCVVNVNNWVHFFYEPASGSTRLLASVHSGGQNLGNVTVTSYVKGTPVNVPACGALTNPYYFTAVMQRSWVITPQFQPSGANVLVRLPFLDSELSSLITFSGQNVSPLDNVGSLGDVKLSKYSGPSNVDDNALNNCFAQGGNQNTQSNFASPESGSTATYSASPAIAVASAKYKDFSIPGFSEFWLHAQSNNTPLPVELTDFSIHCREQSHVEIEWITQSETNSMKYTVEKSRDMEHWNYVSEQIAAGNSNTELKYKVKDPGSQGGTTYYRLLQMDQNGMEKIYGPISVYCAEEENGVAVFPNPVKSVFTVEISSDETLESAQIQLSDLSGKIVLQKEIKIVKGKNQILLDDADLANGSYMVRVLCEDKTFNTVKFLVKK